MSDCIQATDITFSTVSPEWHGKANVSTKEEIREEMEKNIFPITYRKIPLFGEAENGEKITFPGRSLCVADASLLPVDSRRPVHPEILSPLACPGDVFEPLQNADFFGAVESAFDSLGLPLEIVTAGTLCDTAKFYVSINIDSLSFVGPDGKKILGFLSLLNAANNENAASAILERFRVVCHNTYQATLNGSSDFKLSGKHTKNGNVDFLESIEKWIDDLGKANAVHLRELSVLADTAISRERALAIADGYSFAVALKQGQRISDSVELTTQAMRASDSIVDLSYNGKGNRGGDLYQLLQGATDHWTNGDGVGSERVGLSKRISRAKWGSANEHKTAFADYLLSGFYLEAEKIGERARVNKMAAN